MSSEKGVWTKSLLVPGAQSAPWPQNAFGGQSGSPMVDLDMELSLNVIRESRNYSVKLLERKFRMSLIIDLKLSIIVLGQEKSIHCGIKKAHQKRKISSSINAQIIADFYRDVMCNDSTPFDEFQQMVHNTDKTMFREWSVKPEHIAFTDRQIERATIALRKNVSPGIDGITTEHFIYGNCESLRTHLKCLFNGMFQEILVPSFLKTGIIIPIWKKATLDPNIPNNNRPITLSSTHGKLIEFLILPQDTAHSNQFGYWGAGAHLWPAHLSMMCCNSVALRDQMCSSVVLAPRNVSIRYGTRVYFKNCSIY